MDNELAGLIGPGQSYPSVDRVLLGTVRRDGRPRMGHRPDGELVHDVISLASHLYFSFQTPFDPRRTPGAGARRGAVGAGRALGVLARVGEGLQEAAAAADQRECGDGVDVAHVPQVERDRAGEHPGCQLLGAGGDGNGDGQATALHSPAAPRGADKEATSNRKRSVTCPKLPNPRRGKSSVLHQCQHSVRGTACG